MELKNSYKQTEVGEIPNDWKVSTLGKVASIIGGGTPSSFINAYWNGNIDWYTPTEIGNEKYSYHSKRKITKLGLNNSSAKMLPVGAIMLTTRAGIGDVSILMNEGCTNQGFQSFVAENNIDNEYLYYLISTLKSIFLQNASGSTFLEINPNKIRAISIPLPPTKSEQTAIATVLRDTDALITSLEKLIAKKRAIKQGVMQELLIPKRGWEVKKVSEIGLVGRGRVISHKEIGRSIHGLFPVYSSQTSNNGIMGYLDTFDFDGEYVTWTTDGENAGTVFYRNGQFNCTNVCGIIKIKNDNPRYVTYVLNKLTPMHVSKNLANPKLMNDPMKKIEVTLPPVEQQNEISNTLYDLDFEIISLEDNLKKYKLVKLGIMQELLTGKTRLV